MMNQRICSVDGCERPYYARGWCSMHRHRWLKHGDPLKTDHYKTPQLSFEARTMPEPNSGCLIWTGSLLSDGYGQIAVNGKMMRAHRFSWEESNGPIPEGIYVLHTCDNRVCVNPDHLFLGTQQDNMDDMVRKGRQSKGELNGGAKLTEAGIKLIRGDSRSLSKIADDYGVVKSHICNIQNFKIWRHV